MYIHAIDIDRIFALKTGFGNNAFNQYKHNRLMKRTCWSQHKHP
jgi:hypothetical protein